MSPIALDRRKLRQVALTAEEYLDIVERLGREPNEVELGMLGVLWSEPASGMGAGVLGRNGLVSL